MRSPTSLTLLRSRLRGPEIGREDQGINQIRDEQGGDRALQIERAVANFRLALRMKKGSLTEEQIHAITDIIDAAAKQIERA